MRVIVCCRLTDLLGVEWVVSRYVRSKISAAATRDARGCVHAITIAWSIVGHELTAPPLASRSPTTIGARSGVATVANTPGRRMILDRLERLGCPIVTDPSMLWARSPSDG